MRPLKEIITDARTGGDTYYDEVLYALVAYDVMLAGFDLENDPDRLQQYLTVLDADPEKFVGPANDPKNPEAVRHYKAFDNIDIPG